MLSPPATEITPDYRPRSSLPIPRFVTASFILWLISCALPSLDFATYSSNGHLDEMSTVFGVWTLGFGFCCGYYYYQFAGYANLFLVGSWVFAWRHRSV